MTARKIFSGVAAALLAFTLLGCDDDSNGDVDVDVPDVEAPDVDVDEEGDDGDDG